VAEFVGDRGHQRHRPGRLLLADPDDGTPLARNLSVPNCVTNQSMDRSIQSCSTSFTGQLALRHNTMCLIQRPGIKSVGGIQLQRAADRPDRPGTSSPSEQVAEHLGAGSPGAEHAARYQQIAAR